MTTVHASFNELKGIGPATEAKLHAAGLRTWAALAETLDAIAGVRNIDAARLRGLRDEAKKKVDERQPALVSDGEQISRFILVVTARSDGQIARTNITDVRSELAQSFNGLPGADIVEFIEQGIDEGASGAEALGEPADEPAGPPLEKPIESIESDVSEPIRFAASSIDNDVVTIDAGKAIGGGKRHIKRRWDTSNVEAGTAGRFRYRASLAGRPYGVGVTRWRSLGILIGTARPGESVELAFETVGLSTGINRLELTIEVKPLGQTESSNGRRRVEVVTASAG